MDKWQIWLEDCQYFAELEKLFPERRGCLERFKAAAIRRGDFDAVTWQEIFFDN